MLRGSRKHVENALHCWVLRFALLFLRKLFQNLPGRNGGGPSNALGLGCNGAFATVVAHADFLDIELMRTEGMVATATGGGYGGC